MGWLLFEAVYYVSGADPTEQSFWWYTAAMLFGLFVIMVVGLNLFLFALQFSQDQQGAAFAAIVIAMAASDMLRMSIFALPSIVLLGLCACLIRRYYVSQLESTDIHDRWVVWLYRLAGAIVIINVVIAIPRQIQQTNQVSVETIEAFARTDSGQKKTIVRWYKNDPPGVDRLAIAQKHLFSDLAARNGHCRVAGFLSGLYQVHHYWGTLGKVEFARPAARCFYRSGKDGLRLFSSGFKSATGQKPFRHMGRNWQKIDFLLRRMKEHFQKIKTQSEYFDYSTIASEFGLPDEQAGIIGQFCVGRKQEDYAKQLLAFDHSRSSGFKRLAKYLKGRIDLDQVGEGGPFKQLIQNGRYRAAGVVNALAIGELKTAVPDRIDSIRFVFEQGGLGAVKKFSQGWKSIMDKRPLELPFTSPHRDLQRPFYERRLNKVIKSVPAKHRERFRVIVGLTYDLY